MREYLENKGSLFQSTSDSEILAHLIKKETRYHDRPRIFSIIDALNMLEGAFAFLIMTANRIYACRDKYGLRPLAIGRLATAMSCRAKPARSTCWVPSSCATSSRARS